VAINVQAVLKTLLAVLYPYLVYQGIQSGVVWFAPMVIISFYLYQAFHSVSRQERVTKTTIAGVLLIGVIFFSAATAKILPVAIQLLLMQFFGKTLFPKHAPPLIERFVRLEFAELPAGMVAYSRLLTMIWTGLFAFNTLVCVLLAFFAPVSWWAVFTGVGIFLLTGLLMIGEYIYRHFLFPELEFPDLKSSMKNRVKNCKSIWQDVQAGDL
jgi:uncharacterized membrane protein